MNEYIIDQRFHTLAENYINIERGNRSFNIKDIEFSSWDRDLGARDRYWIISYKTKAENFIVALEEFYKKINPLISKITMLSQCYGEVQNEPYLIKKKDSEIFFLRYTRKSSGVPLAFDEDSLKGLTKLESEKNTTPEFYYYWNDMLNVTGYSAKLLLLCASLEALAKGQNANKYDFFDSILGSDLRKKMWIRNFGVRHRLIHGEYLNDNTDKENYLEQAYNKVIDYFNQVIFKEGLIRAVVNPQRHPEGNKEGGYYFLKPNSETPPIIFKSVIEGCDSDFSSYLNQYDILSYHDNYTKF